MGQRHSSVSNANSGRCTVCFEPLLGSNYANEKETKRRSQMSTVCGRCSRGLKRMGVGVDELSSEISTVAPPPYEVHLHGLKTQRPRTASGGENRPLRHRESVQLQSSLPRRPATSSGRRPQTSQGLVRSPSESLQKNPSTTTNFSRESARVVMEKRRQMKKVGCYQDEWDGWMSRGNTGSMSR
ncbi:hypothetical protein Moror_467 [Moniliophthora roreri MCA 2997]|uniref:Uncharacterized protein n=1 Tax=Moniliophthora roreri (strain MCA 2997) TaxID=1381753 RepID=V2XYT9_MONRO|nr:hypothetical protein Moror_467 [Moniliophthora roreri MCA 2997]